MAQIVGVFRIGKDAVLRDAGDTTVINLALASNYGKKDREGNRPTQWVDAAIWGKRAEALEQYLLKGQQVYCVINDPHMETYETRDGAKGSKLVGTIAEIELVGGRPSGDREEKPARREREERPARQERQPQKPAGGFDDMDDDIPF